MFACAWEPLDSFGREHITLNKEFPLRRACSIYWHFYFLALVRVCSLSVVLLCAWFRWLFKVAFILLKVPLGAATQFVLVGAAAETATDCWTWDSPELRFSKVYLQVVLESRNRKSNRRTVGSNARIVGIGSERNIIVVVIVVSCFAYIHTNTHTHAGTKEMATSPWKVFL